MSPNDEGVEAVSCLCSSGVMNFGSPDWGRSVTAGIRASTGTVG